MPTTDPATDLAADLAAAISAAETADPRASLSVSYGRLATGADPAEVWFDHRSDAPHYAASTMKLPVLLAAYRLRDEGRLDLDREIEVRNSFTSVLGGSFTVDAGEDSDPQVWARLGETAPLRWLLARMIVRSSNLATDLVLDQVGTDAVQAALASCGDQRTAGVSVRRWIEDGPARARGVTNLITTGGLSAILTALHRSRPAAAATCAEILAVLLANESADDIRAGTPAGVAVAHKEGQVTGVVHDTALVLPTDAAPYVLTVATSTDWPAGRAHDFVADLARICWRGRQQGPGSSGPVSVRSRPSGTLNGA